MFKLFVFTMIAVPVYGVMNQWDPFTSIMIDTFFVIPAFIGLFFFRSGCRGVAEMYRNG